MTSRFDRAFRSFAVWILSLIARLKFRVSRNVIDEPTKGSLILCNHTSVWDFAYLLFALRPRNDMRFVATAVQYDKSRFTRWLFTHLGLIRKNQGVNDTQCVRNMLKASRKGDTIVIYPAGMTSVDGRPAWKPIAGTGALAKLLNCDVYTAIIHGGYLSHPRFSTKSARGRVEIEIRRLYTAEQVKKLSPDEIQTGMDEALFFNEWDWQEQKQIPFRRFARLRNLRYVLYRCPACGREGTMEEKGKTLFCTACGFSARRDEFGFLRSDSPACPGRIDRWADLEIAAVNGELQSDAFALRTPVTLLKREDGSGKGFEKAGEGELIMTKDELCFEGNETIRVEIGDIQFLIVSGVEAVIVNAGNMNYRFEFKDSRLLFKWFFANRRLKET